MTSSKKGLVGGLVIGLGIGVTVWLLPQKQTLERVGHGAVEALRDGQFALFRPYTPDGLSPEVRLRLTCGSDPAPACLARHQTAVAARGDKASRFEAAFAEAISRSRDAGFDWANAEVVSIDKTGLSRASEGHDGAMQGSGVLQVHGQTPASGGFVLELTECANIRSEGWFCGILRWRPKTGGKDIAP